MSGYRLTPASAADLAALAALHGECFPGESWDESALHALWRHDGAWCGVAWHQGSPTGFVLARLAGGEAEILTLCVRPQMRRRGVARALLDALLTQLEQLAVAEIYLEVAEDNLAALALYHTSGFKLVGRRTAYYRSQDGITTDARVLRRTVP